MPVFSFPCYGRTSQPRAIQPASSPQSQETSTFNRLAGYLSDLKKNHANTLEMTMLQLLASDLLQSKFIKQAQHHEVVSSDLIEASNRIQRGCEQESAKVLVEHCDKIASYCQDIEAEEARKLDDLLKNDFLKDPHAITTLVENLEVEIQKATKNIESLNFYTSKEGKNAQDSIKDSAAIFQKMVLFLILHAKVYAITTKGKNNKESQKLLDKIASLYTHYMDFIKTVNNKNKEWKSNIFIENTNKYGAEQNRTKAKNDTQPKIEKTHRHDGVRNAQVKNTKNIYHTKSFYRKCIEYIKRTFGSIFFNRKRTTSTNAFSILKTNTIGSPTTLLTKPSNGIQGAPQNQIQGQFVNNKKPIIKYTNMEEKYFDIYPKDAIEVITSAFRKTNANIAENADKKIDINLGESFAKNLFNTLDNLHYSYNSTELPANASPTSAQLSNGQNNQDKKINNALSEQSMLNAKTSSESKITGNTINKKNNQSFLKDLSQVWHQFAELSLSDSEGEIEISKKTEEHPPLAFYEDHSLSIEEYESNLALQKSSERRRASTDSGVHFNEDDYDYPEEKPLRKSTSDMYIPASHAGPARKRTASIYHAKENNTYRFLPYNQKEKNASPKIKNRFRIESNNKNTYTSILQEAKLRFNTLKENHTTSTTSVADTNLWQKAALGAWFDNLKARNTTSPATPRKHALNLEEDAQSTHKIQSPLQNSSEIRTPKETEKKLRTISSKNYRMMARLYRTRNNAATLQKYMNEVAQLRNNVAQNKKRKVSE